MILVQSHDAHPHISLNYMFTLQQTNTNIGNPTIWRALSLGNYGFSDVIDVIVQFAIAYSCKMYIHHIPMSVGFIPISPIVDTSALRFSRTSASVDEQGAPVREDVACTGRGTGPAHHGCS